MADSMNQTVDHAKQLELAQEREKVLIEQKNEMEADFGQKRAQFMDMYKQKEVEIKGLKSEIQKLQRELDEVRSEVTIKEVTKNDEIEDLYAKYQSEIESMRQLMNAAVTQATQDVTSRYEEEQEKAQKSKQQIEEELEQIKAKMSQEKESLLSSVAKKLQKKVGSSLMDAEAENLEDSMKKAQENAEALRSVVIPLEQELESTRAALRQAHQRIHQLETSGSSTAEGDTTDNAAAALNIHPKMKELNHHLETEKASRTDLEMFVSVLNTQKSVLQDDVNRLQAQLTKVEKELDEEKRLNASLKASFMMAKDQLTDMDCVEAVLTDTQKLLVQEKKAEREKQRRDEQKQKQAADASTANPPISTAVAVEDDDDVKLCDLSEKSVKSQSSSASSSLLDLSAPAPSSAPTTGTQVPTMSASVLSGTGTDSASVGDDSTALVSTVSNVSGTTDNRSDVGSLSSRLDTSQIQKELMGSTPSRRCEMCNNYETQVQNLQESNKKQMAQLRTLERQLESERKAMSQQETLTDELETALKKSHDLCNSEISQLITKLESSQQYITTMTAKFTSVQNDLQDKLTSLRVNRTDLQKQLDRLQSDNDKLINKNSKHSQQLQEEVINLPNTVEELQLTLLKWREDLIAAKVSREHTEETLHSEIMFLKDQIRSEQQERSTVEDTLASEMSTLQSQLDKLQKVQGELERQLAITRDLDSRLKDSQHNLQKHEAQSKLTITTLQQQVQQLADTKSKLERDVQQYKSRLQSTQGDLDTCEAVQRDFVKLSQSLQVQLERIRSSEQEVRWQHEEDVEDCTNCKQSFSVTKRKHHCRHCGKVFCADCVTKSVASGPKLRSSRVCDVCHTILVQDAQPYFSTEPPTMPT